MWDKLKTLVQRLAGQPRSRSDTPLERSLSKLSREQAETIRVLVERDEETIRTRFGFLLASFGFRFVSAGWFPRGRYILLENDLLRLAYVHREREVTSWFLADRSEREPIVNYQIELLPEWYSFSDIVRDKIGLDAIKYPEELQAKINRECQERYVEGLTVETMLEMQIFKLEAFIPTIIDLVSTYGSVTKILNPSKNQG
jgi:hypothetical protein